MSGKYHSLLIQMANGIFLVINLSKIIKKLLKFISSKIINQFYNTSKLFRILSILSLSIFIMLVLLALKSKIEPHLIETILIVIFICGTVVIFFHPIPNARYDALKKIPRSDNYNNNDSYSEIIQIEFNGYNNWFFKNYIHNKILVIFIRNKTHTNDDKLEQLANDISNLYAGSLHKRTLLWYPELFIIPILIPEALSNLYYLLLFFIFIIALTIKIFYLYRKGVKVFTFLRIINKDSYIVKSILILDDKLRLALKEHINGVHFNFRNIATTFKLFFPV